MSFLDFKDDGAEQDEARGRPWLLRRTLAVDAAIVGATCVAIGIVAMLPTERPEASHGGYVTAPVVRGNLTVNVHATGTVEPTSLIEVSTELSGTVARVLVKPNDTVRKGQVLAELDSTHLRAQVARARAVVAAARARVKEARADVRRSSADLDRKQRLQSSRFTSERDLDAAEFSSNRAAASVERYIAEIDMAQSDLLMAEASLAKARIVSPVDGVVLRRNVEPGQTLAASLQPPVLFRLAEDLTQMQIRVDVDEADAMSVGAGQYATFMVQALRNKRFVAQVERIHIGPEIVQGVVTYKAVLAFDNRRIRLKPGMTATADIAVNRVQGALLVPNAALRFSPSSDDPARNATAPELVGQAIGIEPAFARTAATGDHDDLAGDASRTAEQRAVYVLDRAGMRRVTVNVGPTDGNQTAVTGNELAEGMRVVVDIADRNS